MVDPTPLPTQKVSVDDVEDAELAYVEKRARFLRQRGWALLDFDADDTRLYWRKTLSGRTVFTDSKTAFEFEAALAEGAATWP